MKLVKGLIPCCCTEGLRGLQWQGTKASSKWAREITYNPACFTFLPFLISATFLSKIGCMFEQAACLHGSLQLPAWRPRCLQHCNWRTAVTSTLPSLVWKHSYVLREIRSALTFNTSCWYSLPGIYSMNVSQIIPYKETDNYIWHPLTIFLDVDTWKYRIP